MKIRTLFCTGAAALALIAGAAQAAKVDIDWADPEEFTDIEAGTNQNQKRFQQRVVDELGEHFRETAESELPADQTLKLTIQDVNLAGDVEYFFTSFDNQGLRVIRDIYFPSIEFSYELRDEDGDVIKSGQENISDIGFKYAGSDRLDSAPLNYEKELIESWFEDTF